MGRAGRLSNGWMKLSSEVEEHLIGGPKRKKGGSRERSSSVISDDAKIFVDLNRPATLHNGAVSTDWPTLRDAVMAWHRLRPEQAREASIRLIGGPLFTSTEIPKLLGTYKPPPE
jgi:hypothetical protein